MKLPWPLPFCTSFVYLYGYISGASQLEEQLLPNRTVLFDRIVGQSVARIENILSGRIATAHPLSSHYNNRTTEADFRKANEQFDAIIKEFKIREMVEKYLASPEQ